MTCIVGLVSGNCVLLGADSAAIDEDGCIDVQQHPKVFHKRCKLSTSKHSVQMTIGYAGSFRVGQVLEHVFCAPDWNPRTDVFAYMVRFFIPRLQAVLSSSKIEPSQVELLVALQGRLFEIDSELQVLESTHAFSAIGCAKNVALGSLYTSAGGEVERIETALDAASQFVSGVRPPYTIVLNQSLIL